MSSILRVSTCHRIRRLTSFVTTKHRKYTKDIPRPVATKLRDAEPTTEVFSSKAKPPTNPLSADYPDKPRSTFAAEQLPRLPPPFSKEFVVETFESTSKPKPYLGRPPPPWTELPLQKVSRFPSKFLLSSHLTLFRNDGRSSRRS